MEIPPVLLRFVGTIRPYLGATSTGPQLGDPFTARCFAEYSRRLVTSREGRKVTANATVWFAPGIVCPPESLVAVHTLAGGLVVPEARVLTSTPRLGGGLPVPDHLEIALS